MTENLTPNTKEQIAAFSQGMKTAVGALGRRMAEEERRAGRTRTERKEYEDGSVSHIEIWDVAGQKIDLNRNTQSGLYPQRNDGSTHLRKPLTEAPDRNGRSAIIFDNEKSVFIQDGVAYIFGSNELLKEVPIDELPAITVGARDSVKIYSRDEKGSTVSTQVIGKPIAVAVESLKQ